MQCIPCLDCFYYLVFFKEVRSIQIIFFATIPFSPLNSRNFFIATPGIALGIKRTKKIETPGIPKRKSRGFGNQLPELKKKKPTPGHGSYFCYLKLITNFGFLSFPCPYPQSTHPGVQSNELESNIHCIFSTPTYPQSQSLAHPIKSFTARGPL